MQRHECSRRVTAREPTDSGQTYAKGPCLQIAPPCHGDDDARTAVQPTAMMQVLAGGFGAPEWGVRALGPLRHSVDTIIIAARGAGTTSRGRRGATAAEPPRPSRAALGGAARPREGAAPEPKLDARALHSLCGLTAPYSGCGQCRHRTKCSEAPLGPSPALRPRARARPCGRSSSNEQQR